ncbi:MAG: HAD family hydrolase [Methylovulum miyakonense]|uniref:HAD family hydrolase n=1 Tax=Methylovulum miyakonense TaxID=645578 RepID=UPI003BB66E7F
MKKIIEYKSIIFDCDGVILDSNRIKTDAFYETALQYSENVADIFVAYHRQNGGISRYRKFEFLFSEILRRPPDAGEMDNLLAEYARLVREGLLSCPVTEGLAELRTATCDARWLVVSGGDQAELRRVFLERNLRRFFDGGIYGAPDNKDEILAREVGNGNIQNPAIFVGDSRYDYESSKRAGLDFLFISQWTEFSGWQEFFGSNQIPSIDCINQLAN